MVEEVPSRRSKWDGYRRAYIHAGTHKTGTTALQMLLAQSGVALHRAGFLFPRVGRPARLLGSDIAGHHNIAWELLGDGRFDARDGTLHEALAEIERAELPIVLLSSEDFALCFDRPGLFEAMRNALHSAGYDPYALVYLRPQRGYAHSLYTELVKQGAALGFERFIDDVLGTGAFSISGYTMPFDYAPLVDSLAECFGAERTIVRPYRPGAPPDALPRDYVAVVQNGLALDVSGLTPAGVQNSGATYRGLARALYENVRAKHCGSLEPERLERESFGPDEQHLLDVAFAPLTAADDAAFHARFAASNDALAARFEFVWGVDPPVCEQPRQRAFLQRAAELWMAA